MSPHAQDLDDLLARFDAEVADLTRELVAVLAEVRPDFAAAVKSGWGSINYRHPKAGFICAIFPGTGRVQLMFEQGRLLSSPLLRGGEELKQVRWVEMAPGRDIPVDEIAILIAEAIALRV